MFHFHRAAGDKAVALSGYLMKQKRPDHAGLGDWNQRWFAIEGRSLVWYVDESAAEKHGTIDLGTVSRIEKHTHGDHSFVLYSPARDLRLRAKSDGELLMWVRALELYADLARGGDGSSVITAPPVSKSVRVHHADIDTLHDDEEEAAVEAKHHEAPPASPLKTVFHVDRAEGHNTKIVHQSQEGAEAKGADEASQRAISLKSRIINNPMTYDPEREADGVREHKHYDEHHHLVTDYSIDHGVTTYFKDGSHHTNFYF